MADAVNSKMVICQTEVQEYTTRDETLNGREYVVVPVTMMVEGVHQGSHGALLHTAEELGKIPESWNGIPVTIGHPMVEGNPVSANSPSILESWAVGIIFNTLLNGTKLKSEAWLEKNKLANHENLNDRISNGEIIEVSVGVFSEDEDTEGTWHNESYVAVARNLRPDHLAILPNQVGACSNADGCGIRINSENMEINETNRTLVLNQLKQQGFNVSQLVVNESLLKLVEKIRSKVYSMDKEGEWYYVEDIDDSFLIYTKSIRDGESKLYKQGYACAADESIVFVGEPVEVLRKVEYETVMNNNTEIKRTRKLQTNSKKEDENMADEKCKPCISQKATELIANAATQFTEKDRGWLETFEEDQLDKMIPKTTEPVVNKEVPKITPEMAVNALREGLKNEDDFIKLMPVSMQEQTRSALRLHEDHKASLIDSILANTEEGTWTKDELQVYEVGKLEKIAKTAKVQAPAAQVNYTGMMAGGNFQTNAQNDVPMLEPVGITFNK